MEQLCLHLCSRIAGLCLSMLSRNSAITCPHRNAGVWWNTASLCPISRPSYGIPYRTGRSIRNSEIAYGIFAEWFCCGNPRSKIAYGILLTIQSRYGIDSETPIAIRIPYGIGNPLPKFIAASNREGYQSRTCQVPGRHPTLPQHQQER